MLRLYRELCDSRRGLTIGQVQEALGGCSRRTAYRALAEINREVGILTDSPNGYLHWATGRTIYRARPHPPAEHTVLRRGLPAPGFPEPRYLVTDRDAAFAGLGAA
jgi:hypothetical protein